MKQVQALTLSHCMLNVFAFLSIVHIRNYFWVQLNLDYLDLWELGWIVWTFKKMDNQEQYQSFIQGMASTLFQYICFVWWEKVFMDLECD